MLKIFGIIYIKWWRTIPDKRLVSKCDRCHMSWAFTRFFIDLALKLQPSTRYPLDELYAYAKVNRVNQENFSNLRIAVGKVFLGFIKKENSLNESTP